MSVEQLLKLSNSLAGQNQLQEAELKVRQAIQLEPNSAIAYNLLGFILGKQPDQLMDAEAAVRRAIALKPDFADAYNHLGFILGKQGKFALAQAALRKAIALNPNNTQARKNLQVILKQGATASKSDSAEDYNTLGIALWHQGKLTDAETAFQKALQLKPDYPEAINHLGAVFYRRGRLLEADMALRKAIALKPDYPEAHKNLAAILQNQGKFAEAQTSLRKAIALKPDFAEAYRNLSELKKYSEGDPDLVAMEQLLSGRSLAGEDSIYLYFALAKAWEDIGNTSKSFDYLSRGNQLKHSTLNFNITDIEAEVQRQIQVFTPSLFERYGQLGCPSDLPIFIVGMPRSGTTLVEQILASHPQVYGAGELNYLEQLPNQLAKALSLSLEKPQPFPECLTSITTVSQKQLRKAGAILR